ncbi:MAG: sensor histidine kinase [Gemmatimonadales bacterium]
MQSIRSRLVVYYSLALTGTMIAFGAAVYWERAVTGPREAALAVDSALSRESAFATRVLRQQYRTLRSKVRDSPAAADSMAAYAKVYLDAIPDNVFIANSSGRVMYSSPVARSLPVDAATAIARVLQRNPPPSGVGEIADSAGGPPLRYNVEPIDTANDIGTVLVGTTPVINTTELRQIMLSMILVGPVILVASGSLGYWLAGRALRPVDTMIAELDAIQDGTALHRRLPLPPGEDELRRLAQKLNDMLARVERSFVALRRFTADASHELKTPLMVLRAGVERALTHPQTPDEIVSTLDETLRQINQMSELVTNLLTLARADEGRGNLALADTDITALVAEAAETAEILGDSRQIAVRVEVPPRPVMLAVDANRIRLLLMNLATNAVKYTPPGGRVTLALHETPDLIAIAVQDTGIGIAPGDLPNIFERFWRADIVRSRTGEHPGTGLGLAISRWIAEAHGGTIAVQSRPGRGSTFTVELPRTAAG